MHEHIIRDLALIVVLGISAQWLAWQVRLPSILLLLTFGFVAGPVTHLLVVFPRFCGHRKKSCSPLQGCALELGGAKVAQGRVAALSIVKDFYIFE